jgi:hypothetical protein
MIRLERKILFYVPDNAIFELPEELRNNVSQTNELTVDILSYENALLNISGFLKPVLEWYDASFNKHIEFADDFIVGEVYVRVIGQELSKSKNLRITDYLFYEYKVKASDYNTKFIINILDWHPKIYNAKKVYPAISLTIKYMEVKV